jgi:hypothetical protein
VELTSGTSLALRGWDNAPVLLSRTDGLDREERLFGYRGNSIGNRIIHSTVPEILGIFFLDLGTNVTIEAAYLKSSWLIVTCNLEICNTLHNTVHLSHSSRPQSG